MINFKNLKPPILNLPAQNFHLENQTISDKYLLEEFSLIAVAEEKEIEETEATWMNKLGVA